MPIGIIMRHYRHASKFDNQLNLMSSLKFAKRLKLSCQVRLHVGSTAPTSIMLGRRIKDSGDFQEDYLKVNSTLHVQRAGLFV